MKLGQPLIYLQFFSGAIFLGVAASAFSSGNPVSAPAFAGLGLAMIALGVILYEKRRKTLARCDDK